MSGLLKKPTLTNAEKALEFGKGATTANQEAAAKRAFFAPEGYRRLTINLPEALHKKLKLTAVQQDCTATEIIERLLKKELED